MKNQPRTFNSRALPRFLRAIYIAGLLPALVFLLNVQSIQADSATWKPSPASGDWNTAMNWTPATVPNGASDIASFASSTQRSVSLSNDVKVNGINFHAGASAFDITVSPQLTLALAGAGIANNSGVTQTFVIAGNNGSGSGSMVFTGNAQAGTGTLFTVDSGVPPTTGFGPTDSFMEFHGSSSADHARIVLNGAVGGGTSGIVFFYDTSTAGSATFVVNGSGKFSRPGEVTFYGDFTTKLGATAGNATFTLNAATAPSGEGGNVRFGGFSTAGSATLTLKGSNPDADSATAIFFLGGSAGDATLVAEDGINGGPGGLIRFFKGSDGGRARVKVFGSGTLDTTQITERRPKATLSIGSLEGDGRVLLPTTKLRVGLNNMDTTFSGVIRGFSTGSLEKIGTGTLALTSANTYAGGTAVTKGTLLAESTTGSSTGTGPVQVNSGTLGGPGRIGGAVTMGDGSHSATLLGGSNANTRGTLTINDTLTFNSLSIYKCVLNRTSGNASRINALGVTINSGANFTFVDTGMGTLAPGTVLMVISNISASPIAGTFANLADGSTFTSNGNSFRANYQGNDGNDLTLTVVR